MTACRWERCDESPTMDHYCSPHFESIRKKWNAKVYFIAAGNYIKIGYALNPQSRLKEIQIKANVSLPVDMSEGDLKAARILAVEGGGAAREARLHSLFREFRVAGEWFKRSPEIVDYVASLDAISDSADVESDPLEHDEYLRGLMDAVVQTHARSKKRVRGATGERDAAVRAARSAGITGGQIARALGVTGQRVTQMAQGWELGKKEA